MLSVGLVPAREKPEVVGPTVESAECVKKESSLKFSARSFLLRVFFANRNEPGDAL